MRTPFRLACVTLLGAIVATPAGAQQPPPQPGPYQPPPQQPYYPQQPPPGGYAPPPGQAPPGAQPYPGQPAPGEQYPGQPAAPGAPAPGPGAPAPQPGVEGGFTFGAQAGAEGFGAAGDADVMADEPSIDEEQAERDWRVQSLKIQNSLHAATGLLRTYSADSGAAGTFRFSLWSSYFSGSGFLCPTCEPLDGGDATQEDEVTHISGHIGISATPVEFLEAFLGIHSHATSNTLGRPELLQVLGDTNLGVKAFMPHRPDQIFSAGGALELWLLNGTGGVGIDGASYAIRGLATADLSNRIDPDKAIPLRAHLNLGYLFNNSGNLVDDVEASRGGNRITRIERFGLDIDRVDSFKFGLGVEGVFDVVRPFLEWTIDVPVNRQDHVCDIATQAADDQCLGDAAGFGTTPSRISLGARVFPWLEGLALNAAFDIGTGATSSFVEEVAPELPWNLHFGLAYAVDVEPRVEVQKVPVEAPSTMAPAAEAFIEGIVREAGSQTPIPDAIVRFEGRQETGMVTTQDGTFRTRGLDPGTYTFSVTAEGYKPGQCSATIPPAGAPFGAQPGMAPQPAYPGAPPPGGQPGFADPYAQQPGGPGQPGQPDPAMGAPAAAPGTGSQSTRVECELEALPKVGNVNGMLRDAESNAAVGGASVKITDKLNRSLSLTSDAGGSFRFENVPPGIVTITAEAPGYLRSVTELEIQPRQDVSAQISLNKRPTQPNVVVTPKEIKLKKEVHFQHNSSEILPDSMAILEEIADVLRTHGEITSVEIQGHTDNSGTAAYNLRLSQDRAEAVREALVRNGVDASRLTAKGYGQERPLVPNTTEANRAKNRRVQLMIER